MSRARRLSRIDASCLAAEVPYLTVGWFRFAPRPDGSVPGAEEIVSHAENVLRSVFTKDPLNAAPVEAVIEEYDDLVGAP